MERRQFIQAISSIFLTTISSCKLSAKNSLSPEITKLESDHFDGERFFNPGGVNFLNSFSDLLKWRFFRKPIPWEESYAGFKDTPPERVQGESIRLSYVGHATVLLQTEGLNILVDPVWSEKASPVSFAGPERVTPPGIDMNALPVLDVILITHNHYDHLDLESLKEIYSGQNPRIIVPLGNAHIIKEELPQIHVEEFDWEETVPISDSVSLTLQQAFHWSARGVFDKNKSLWCAYVLETPHGNIYLAGDTGFNNGEHVIKTHDKFGDFRLAVLPIGAYKPRWFMSKQHVNPEEAVKLALMLGAEQCLGIHLQTFEGLTDEGYDEPVIDLKKALQKHGYQQDNFKVLIAGQHWTIG